MHKKATIGLLLGFALLASSSRPAEAGRVKRFLKKNAGKIVTTLGGGALVTKYGMDLHANAHAGDAGTHLFNGVADVTRTMTDQGIRTGADIVAQAHGAAMYVATEAPKVAALVVERAAETVSYIGAHLGPYAWLIPIGVGSGFLAYKAGKWAHNITKRVNSIDENGKETNQRLGRVEKASENTNERLTGVEHTTQETSRRVGNIENRFNGMTTGRIWEDPITHELHIPSQ